MSKFEIGPWLYLLDVVNCSRSMIRDVVRQDAYMCPDTGGPYSHERAKYFGPYANKKVEWIYEIRAVVAIHQNFNGGYVKWKNNETDDRSLVGEARQKIEATPHRLEEIKKHGMQVFLLERPVKTNFYKPTKGGLFGSKKYFRGVGRGCATSEELAAKLKDRPWSDFE